jgi:putative exporter of polyketide antibiotics
VAAGEVFGYLGPNGAGKTTTIRLLLAMIRIGRLVAPTAAKAISNSADIRQVLGRLGAQPGSAAYLGVIYLVGAALTCFAAESQITATRAEEADGHADHLLARPVSRWRWLAGRLAVTAALIIAASLTAGLAGWAGVTGQHTGLGFT